MRSMLHQMKRSRKFCSICELLLNILLRDRNPYLKTARSFQIWLFQTDSPKRLSLSINPDDRLDSTRIKMSEKAHSRESTDDKYLADRNEYFIVVVIRSRLGQILVANSFAMQLLRNLADRLDANSKFVIRRDLLRTCLQTSTYRTRCQGSANTLLIAFNRTPNAIMFTNIRRQDFKFALPRL